MRKLFILLTALLLVGCTATEQPESPDTQADDATIQIITTIPPLYSLASQVGGDLVAVDNLVEPGQSVHTWEPKPSDIVLLEEADLLVLNGLELEHFVEELIEDSAFPNLTVIETADSIPEDQLLEFGGDEHADEEDDDHGHHEEEDEEHHDDDHDHGHDAEEEHHEEDDDHHHHHGDMDPHTWLSPALAAFQADAIKDSLQEIDPENAAIYEANYEALAVGLAELETNAVNQLGSVEPQPFIVFHDAYSYLLEAAGLLDYMAAAIEEFPGKEPSPAFLQELSEIIEARGVTTIFVEPQFSPDLAEFLAAEFNLTIGTLDPLGAELAINGYQNNLEKNVAELVRVFTEPNVE